MADLLKNFVQTKLTSPITSSTTTLPVEATSAFPDVTTGEFYCTLLEQGKSEIVRITGLTGPSYTYAPIASSVSSATGILSSNTTTHLAIPFQANINMEVGRISLRFQSVPTGTAPTRVGLATNITTATSINSIPWVTNTEGAQIFGDTSVPAGTNEVQFVTPIVNLVGGTTYWLVATGVNGGSNATGYSVSFASNSSTYTNISKISGTLFTTSGTTFSTNSLPDQTAGFVLQDPTVVSSASLVAQRAQESTVAQAFGVGTVVKHALTAGMFARGSNLANKHRGAWSNTATYAAGEIVTFNGGTYVAKQTSGPVTSSRAALTGTATARIGQDASPSTTHTITIPSTTKVGDLILLGFAHANDSVGITIPGFTHAAVATNQTGRRLRIYTKTAVAGDPGSVVTITYTAAVRGLTQIRSYTTPGLDGSIGATTSNLVSSLTATVANTLQVTFIQAYSGDTNYTAGFLAGGEEKLVHPGSPNNAEGAGALLSLQNPHTATGATSTTNSGVDTATLFNPTFSQLTLLLRPQATPVLPQSEFTFLGLTTAAETGHTHGDLATTAHTHTGFAATSHLHSDAVKSTISSGLPGFVGRNNSDLHYNTTSKQLYIRSGTASSEVFDDFNRADGLLDGQTTTSGGKVWDNRNGVGARITGNRLVRDGGGESTLIIGSGVHEVQADFGYSGSSVLNFGIARNVTSAAGYVLEFNPQSSDPNIGISFRRSGTSVSLTTLSGSMPYSTSAVLRLNMKWDNVNTFSFTLRNLTTNNVVTGTYVDASPIIGNTGVHVDPVSANCYVDDYYALAVGTLAWTSTDEFVGTHAHSDAVVVTQGTAFPPPSTRKVNDLHYRNDLGSIYVLTGAAGAGLTDNFDRANQSGLGTSSSGVAWTTVGGFEVFDNRAYNTSFNTQGAMYNLGSAGDVVAAATSFRHNVQQAIFFQVACRTSTGTDFYDGYHIVIEGNTGTVQAYRNNVSLYNVGWATRPTGAPADSLSYHDRWTSSPQGLTFEVRVVGNVVSFYADGYLVHSFTDATPRTGTFAGMIYNVSGSFGGGTATAPRSMSFDNAQFSSPGTLAWSSGASPSTANRATATYTTASLAPGAGESGVITMGAGYRLLDIGVSKVSRTRLYSSVAKRDADVARAAGTDPTPGTGLQFDYVATSTLGTDNGINPLVDGYVANGTTAVPIRIDNTDTTAGAVTVTFTYVRTE